MRPRASSQAGLWPMDGASKAIKVWGAYHSYVDVLAFSININ